jgi:hypothetical protein
MEVVVAALVLGILYMAVSNLQKGNREALLRIRGRDGATIIAQNVIDSLNSIGLASLSDDLLFNEDSNKFMLNPIFITKSWEGQPGLVSNIITVNYTVDVEVSSDTVFLVRSQSCLDTVEHTYAKRLDVKVSWPFKNSIQTISVSSIIR